MLIPLQQNFNPNGNPPQDLDPAAVAGMIAFYVVLIAVTIGVEVFFLLTLSRCLKEVAPRNRLMEPGQVWLNFIPFFNYVWMFLTVIRVADSLQNEYRDRGLRGDGDYGRTIGLIGCVSVFVCGCASPILGVIYWVKIAGYANALRADSYGEGPGRRDDYDDRDPPRRGRRDDDSDDRFDR